MCARHDIPIGKHLIELEPVEGADQATYLLYLTVSDMSDGNVEWKGCLRLFDGPIWEAIVYGGSPLALDSHTDEVESG